MDPIKARIISPDLTHKFKIIILFLISPFDPQDDQKIVLDDKDVEVIGSPLIKYGDTTVFVQHCESGLWLSYRVRSALDSN